MHHSSEYYTCISDYAAIIFDLMQSFFVPPPIFLVHRNINLLYQFWIHTEVNNCNNSSTRNNFI
uniref:Ovule protein n=1 Tax=Ascaris lumbricoides TaxID=6252 RepID=A0A0M3IH12_ASCLU